MEHRHELNDPAAPTPAFDGKNVYAFFADYGLVSFDGQGQERWKLPLGPFSSLHGIATSPVIAGNSVVLQIDQFNDSYIAAFSTEDGTLRWKKERPSMTGAYSTPAVRRTPGGSVEIIASSSYELVGYDAKDGGRVWWLGGLAFQPKSSPVIGQQRILVVSSAVGGRPVFDDYLEKLDKNSDGMLSVDEGRNPGERHMLKVMDDRSGNPDGLLTHAEWTEVLDDLSVPILVAAQLTGIGDLTKSGGLWKRSRQLPDVASPLLYEGVLYLIKNGGIATALAAETDEVLGQKRLKGAIGTYYSSPVAADGKIYVASVEGKVVVLKAGPELEILAVNDLGEECYATPALADGRIYVRTSDTLFCFGTK